MHDAYEDITSRIKEQPIWYDSNGCPRYDPFHPRLCPDIYATVVVLLRIACQACGQKFDVEMHGNPLYELRVPKNLHYGDPPRHDLAEGQRCGGETMNCHDLIVLQVWKKQDFTWKRYPKLEGPMD